MTLEKPHTTCEKCPWLDFPKCNGNIVDNEPMWINNLRPGFKCGQRTLSEPSYTYIHTPNPKDVKYTKEEVDDLKTRLEELEAKSEVTATK